MYYPFMNCHLVTYFKFINHLWVATWQPKALKSFFWPNHVMPHGNLSQGSK
jgi:hypothetical protein